MNPNEYNLPDQSQIATAYQQLRFTSPVSSPTFNYQYFNGFNPPHTSTNQAFTDHPTFSDYNNVTITSQTPSVTTGQSPGPSAVETPLLRGILLQQYKNVFTQLSESKQNLLNAEQKVKLLLEKMKSLQGKVRDMENMNDSKDDKILYLKVEHIREMDRRSSQKWEVKRLERQLEEVQKKFDWAMKEIEFLNQSDTAKKIEKFRIERIRSTYPDGVAPHGEYLRHYLRPLTKEEEAKILAQIESMEKTVSTGKEASGSASTSINTSPSSSSSSPARLEGIGKDNQKHGICPMSRGKNQACLCGAKFSQRGNLITHILQRTKDGGQFSCSVCEKRFDGTGTLRAHVRKVHQHTLRFSVGCRLCGLAFGSHTQLYEHRKYQHGTTKSASKEKVSKGAGGKRATEPKHSSKRMKGNSEGGKAFSKMKLRNSHTKVMENEKIFSCNICESRFSTVELMMGHYEGHRVTPISSYNCRDCGQVFSSFSELRYHKVDAHQGF